MGAGNLFEFWDAFDFGQPAGACHLVNAAVTDKKGFMRKAKGGWTHARCQSCPLSLWIPKGGSYELADVCKRKAGSDATRKAGTEQG